MAFADRLRPGPIRSQDPAVHQLYKTITRWLEPHRPVPPSNQGGVDALAVTITGSTTSPTLNSGTLTQLWREFGDMVWVHTELTWGSDTVAGSGTYAITLPFPPDPATEQHISGHLHHTGGGGAEAPCAAIVTTAGMARVVMASGARLGSGVGLVTPATGDVLVLQGYYRPA